MGSFRNINVNGVKFLWRVGESFTEIRLAEDNSVFLRLANDAIAGLGDGEVSRGRRKKTSDGMVQPHMIRKIILDRVKVDD